MDLRSGCPYWLLRDGPIHVYPPLDADLSADIAIIGAGISGATCAWYLAEGHSVVVLDRRPAGQGSTAAATSLLQYELDLPLTELAQRIGSDRAERVYRACADALGEIERLAERLGGDLGYRARRSLYLAAGPGDLGPLRDEYQARRAAGFAVEYLSRARLSAEYGIRRPGAIRSGLGGEIDAYRFTHRLLAGAAARGARIFTGSEVRAVQPGSRGLRLITAAGPTVTARRVVIAGGYEAAGQLPAGLARLTSTYAIASQPMEAFAPWSDRCIIWETARPYLYARTSDDGRILVGGGDEPFTDPAARDRLLPAKSRYLAAQFSRLFPDLQFEPACSWAGTFADTPDSLPYVGSRPDRPGVFFSLAYGANGIVFSLLAAQLIRALLAGEAPADAELFGFGRAG